MAEMFSGDFRTMIDGMADPVLIVDPESKKFVYANKAFSSNTGYTPDEVLTMSVPDIHPEKDLPYVLEQFAKQQAGEITLAKDIPVKRRDGSVFYANVNATAVIEGDKKYLVGTFRDVTAMKISGEALRQSEERYRRVVEESMQSVVKLDSDGVILFINETAAERVGDEPQDIIGKTLWDVFPKGLADAYMGSIKETLETGQMRIVERESVVNGRGVWFESILQPVQNEYGQFDSVIVMAVDVTSRKSVELELEKSEQKYRNVADLANDGICIIQATRIKYANRVLEGLLGYGLDEAEDRDFSAFIAPEDLQKVREKYMRQISGTEVSQRYETVLLAKDGRKIPVEVSANLIPYENGQASLVFLRDITAHKVWLDNFNRMNDTLVSLGMDFDENIKKITACCGEMLGGACALYNRLEEGMLCSSGQWQTPPDYEPVDKPDGHICYDVIRKAGGNRPHIVRDLPKTPYFKTDPNVAKYGLKTYVGYPVSLGDKCVGSLCVVYQKDVEPGDNELRFLGILAKAIAQEEMRRIAEKELKRSSELLGNVLSNIPHFVFWKDRQSAFLGCNDNLARVVGLESPEDIVGKTDYDLGFKEEEIEHYRKIDRQVMETGIPVTNMEETQLQADGKEATILTSKVPLRDADGNIVGILGVYADITERKKVMEEVRRAKEYIDLIFAISPSAMFTVDMDRHITAWNDKAADITGFSREEMMGKKCDLFAGEFCSELCDFLSGDIEKPVMGKECEIETKDGRCRIVSKNVDLIKDEAGNVIGAVESFEDVTHRRAMEAALKESEEEYRTIFDNAGTAIILVDKDMKVSMVNAEFERLIGMGREEIEGELSVGDFVYAADVEKVKEYHWLRRLAPESPPKEYELRIVNKTGHIRDVHVTVALMPGGDRSLAAFSDVTTIKRTQETLREQKDLLNKANMVLESKVNELKKALQHIKKLEGLVPICAACKKMFSGGEGEDQEGEWVPLERYISERSGASFTHGLCPECVNRLYADRKKKRPGTGG